MTLAVCPGSFDPVTLGHLDVIKRAAALFDNVIVVVMVNSAKKPTFTIEERVDFLKRATASLKNVEVDTYNGLLADYTAMKKATAVVKGLRVMSDFEYEFQMALTNMSLTPGVETIFLPASIDCMFLSSSMVREVAKHGRDISPFVPEGLAEEITAKLTQKE
ncbi:pantetheine-phosphate adenylyltransferase [[Clostridium] cellulosi]|jgi:Phosphopantetheine adenylyltransferase (EC 2.7.7.3)|uniref:Phosphopantetheine adenylyltransferase n=1 Tax=[Clostridium] cellulosi TaxID=29343 RepID=A0A078KPU5_9FIRM|nr:MAG: pantetheine-phosphate adenylyltransferase [[Clostridium] cellulosi]CDZ24438.1 pantetheine-phosphate adenylyltransferase [[Clostridium] cellulosi]